MIVRMTTGIVFSVALVCGALGFGDWRDSSGKRLGELGGPIDNGGGECAPCSQGCPSCSACDSCCDVCLACDIDHPNWPLPFPENQCGPGDGYPGDGVMLCGIGPDMGGMVDFEEYKFAWPWQSAFIVAVPDDPAVPVRIDTCISRDCSGGIDFTITGDPEFNNGWIAQGWYLWPPRQCIQVHDGELRVFVDVVYADFTAAASRPDEVYQYE